MTEKETIRARLAALRAKMAAEKIDAVIIPTADYHNSEYIADHFKCREFITGFTGSAGTAVITADKAGLWTDSRYYLQAAEQLDGTGVDLNKMQEAGVPSITAFLISTLTGDATVAFDGRLISVSTYDNWASKLETMGIHIRMDGQLFDEIWADIWTDRPALPQSTIFEFAPEYSGVSRQDKIREIRAVMSQISGDDMAAEGSDYLLITDLSDIAWLLNLRASDIHCSPVFMSYLLISQKEVRLFVDDSRVSDSLQSKLRDDGIDIEAYDSLSSSLQNLPMGACIWLSTAEITAAIMESIPATVDIIDQTTPVAIRKACKNSTEQANTRIAHLRDGVAVSKWLYWLKNSVKSGSPLTEISAAEKLHELRAEQEHFMGDSFDPIIAYGEHAAIVHYSATPETSAVIQPRGLLLADTGGHYLEGTTDITRTIVMGPVTDEERLMFTTVLRGHIQLAKAVFPKGSNGGNLDILARKPLWDMGRDYGHGTGHGVGHFLNVHEGPNTINWSANGNIRQAPAFAPGMITSDEPGYYEAGAFGIRHESLLLCTPNTPESTDSPEFAARSLRGDFLSFEEITLVPFDLEGIDPDLMTRREKDYLNAYHKRVREALSPYLTDKERKWLETATAEI